MEPTTIFSTRSESVKELMAALSRAKATFAAIIKDTQAGGGSKLYKYATLDQVIEAITPALLANNLVLSDDLDDDHIIVHLDHAPSGQWKRSRMPIPNPLSVGWQNFGSAVTYARRYLYSPMVGVASEADDDGAYADAKRGEVATPDPFDKVWLALEAIGIKEPAATRAWCETALARALANSESLTLEDIPKLMEAIRSHAEIAKKQSEAYAKPVADIKELSLRLAAELGRLLPVPKLRQDASKKEINDATKSSMLAWVNGFRAREKQVSGFVQLTADELQELIAKAKAGEMSTDEPMPAWMNQPEGPLGKDDDKEMP
jgi:hypothetical protein